MSSSPYITPETKDYMQKFQLEQLINRTVNEVVKKKPADPYSFLISELQELASSDVQIVNLKGIEVVTGEGFPGIKIQATVNYMNKQISFLLPEPMGILNEEAVVYDGDRFGGKGVSKAIQFMNTKLIPKIVGYKCREQTDVDKQLQTLYTQNQKSNLYTINTLSYTLSRIEAHVLSKPLHKVISESVNSEERGVDVMVNCLQGGKAIGSKCKVFKYMIMGSTVKDPYLFQTVMQAVRKSIVSGKGGEAALKVSPDGTFLCPVDTILDNLKIVEEAINGAGAKDVVSIGLSWAADTLFSPETKKYELQNPKTPFDNDQMIDYLIKLLQDKPIIQYLEDPLACSEKAAWKKLITKIKETQGIQTVKVGSRHERMFNLLDDHVQEAIKDICVLVDEESEPEKTQEERKQINENKFTLDFVQVRLFELRTLSTVTRLKKYFDKVKTRLILQDNALQTYDTSIVDVCLGLGAMLNLGSIAKFDRTCKLNRISQINTM